MTAFVRSQIYQKRLLALVITVKNIFCSVLSQCIVHLSDLTAEMMAPLLLLISLNAIHVGALKVELGIIDSNRFDE